MFITRRLPSLLLALSFGAAPLLQAEEGFDSHVAKLADDKYAERAAAVEALVKMCKEKPALLDQLAPFAFDEDGDVERVLNAREVIAKSLYTERGAIGFALDRELIVLNLVANGPAKNSGIPLRAQLLSVSGKSVKGKSPGDIYAMVHATKPGTKLEMEFVDQDGEKLLYYPEVVSRGTIRSDENSEERRKEAYEAWMERKRKELNPQAD